MLEPLVSRAEFARLAGALWSPVFEQPLGVTLQELFPDDTVRGVVATDGLIGTGAVTGALAAVAGGRARSSSPAPR
jgi:hypothetical protein